MRAQDNDVLLDVRHLSVDFPVRGSSLFAKKQIISAVSDASFDIKKGETFGLVGESGCGKTTLANAILGLVEIRGGSVIFRGKELNKLAKSEFLEQRRSMQMIFQDPYSSLNPRFDAFRIIAEPLVIRGGFSREETRDRVVRLLELIGLSKDDMHRYPSAFSGGQKQRLGIARAIALHPELLICDEPVSALDVSVHAQILNLLTDLQHELNLTYLFISHNLAVVKRICSTLAVMYLGKIVEYGQTEAIFRNPLHPYTRALISAVLDIDIARPWGRIILKGETPSPINPPVGCRFAQRCYESGQHCACTPVELVEVEPNHSVVCHKYAQLASTVKNCAH
ncbi:MAG: ABC transporter ATP-binding protein [Bacillota bacterium]